MREAIALLRFSGIAYMRPTKADNRVQLETSFLRFILLSNLYPEQGVLFKVKSEPVKICSVPFHSLRF